MVLIGPFILLLYADWLSLTEASMLLVVVRPRVA